MKPTEGHQPYLLFSLAFSSFHLYYLAIAFLGTYEVFLAYVILHLVLIAIFLVFVRLERSKIDSYGFVIYGDAKKELALAILSVAIFNLIVLEPGFIFGFAYATAPSVFTLGFFLLSAPLVAIAEEGIYRGYIMKKLLQRGTFNRALYISSALYALHVSNLFALMRSGFDEAVRYLFSNTLSALVLGLLMGIYFYKSSWSLLGPISFRTGLILAANLLPVSARTTGWELTFTFRLLAYAALILVINTVIREPRFMLRRYLEQEVGAKRGRFLQRARRSQTLRKTLTGIVGLAFAALSATYGLQAILRTPTPFVAIVTGSMQPALYRGDLVVAQGVGPGEIAPGDIIIYQTPDMRFPIVHRVIDVEETPEGAIYRTKGDYNPTADINPVPYANVLGKVIYRIPLLGHFVLNPPLTVAVIILVLLIPFKPSKRRRREGLPHG